jgi:hypothetical protein
VGLACICNPYTWEAEVGNLKLEASLGYKQAEQRERDREEREGEKEEKRRGRKEEK